MTLLRVALLRAALLGAILPCAGSAQEALPDSWPEGYRWIFPKRRGLVPAQQVLAQGARVHIWSLPSRLHQHAPGRTRMDVAATRL